MKGMFWKNGGEEPVVGLLAVGFLTKFRQPFYNIGTFFLSGQARAKELRRKSEDGTFYSLI
jgi:hypothetical protein